MWLYLLISLGACEALFVLGLFVYWIISNIKKTSRAIQSNSMETERQTPPTITETIAGTSLEQPLDEASDTPDLPSETDNKTEDGDWLNAGVTEVSADTLKQENDDWLNASLSEISTNDYKQQDDDWLNAEISQPAETEDSPSSYQSLQDIITVKPVEETAAESHPLIDDITVKPVQEAVNKSHALIDYITVKPVEEAVNKSYALMDEITVKPVEAVVNKSHPLTDEITRRPVVNQITETHVLMDEISIKSSPGPVHIEYEILDDLITKSAIYRTKKAKPTSDLVITDTVESPVETVEPSGDAIIANPVETHVEKAEPTSDAIITNPVESPVEKPEPVKPVSVNEITEFLKEKRDLKQATIPSLAVESRSTPFLVREGEGRGKLLSQAKNLYKKTALPGAVTKTLAALRILNNNEFYIQDTNLTQVDTLMQEPQIKGFTFKVLTTATELDELVDEGYALVMNLSKIKRGLKKGMVVFFALVDRELAFMGWACITEESKVTLSGYPYNDDLDRQACIVGDWTNPKFQDNGVSSYVKCKRQQLLKEKGFAFERSIAEMSIVKAQENFELTYKRRTYTNISLPGILGVEFWKEHSLKETDAKPQYQMLTLLVLVLPSLRLLPI
jgi:hypothetical protein